jgi:hypothetical protein
LNKSIQIKFKVFDVTGHSLIQSKHFKPENVVLNQSIQIKFKVFDVTGHSQLKLKYQKTDLIFQVSIDVHDDPKVGQMVALTSGGKVVNFFLFTHSLSRQIS